MAAEIFFLNLNLLPGALLVGFILYLGFSHPALNSNSRGKKYDCLVLTFLFVLFLVITKKILDYQIPASYIPVSGLIMCVSILYKDAALSFYFAVLSACFAGILSGNSLSVTLIFFITGMVTAISTRRLRRRIQILSAGLFAGGAQALLFWMAYPQAGINDIAANLFNGLICAVTVTGILPLLENFFGMVTDISLLELSDFNHPLLKKMILDAPGTYHHSIVVGNIAEAAAESIQANSLLARIGGYYHDIGKLNSPEYFMENQKALSKHEHLSPSISKMVIINHIKEGMELAKKYRLKPAIVDFITQHHGSGLVYYFYRKALEEIEQDEKILEEGFRYPGPKPASRETAIVLLADSVEAATRAIAEPNASRIEEVVHKVINNKFIDGQLDNCDLTLKDLEKIAKVFIHMLSGIYHGRINYPESPGHTKEHHHKKHD
ncbi:MAG: HDIG domain-containing protein [Candidatus Omnitrophota bacterium]|nr:HDIG domain-containing protein [Candidatus Omnitrophota bacterium]